MVWDTCPDIALANGGLTGDGLTLIREELDLKLLQVQVGTYLHQFAYAL